MGFFKMLFGICRTAPPTEEDCWRFANGKIEIDLDRAPELKNQGGAIRLEGNGSPERVLVIHGRDGQFHAYKNRCTHVGRRIDPYSEDKLLRCCSISKSTFDYEGNVISGSAKKPLTPFKVEQEGGKLTLSVV
ncbi:MAG: (2Fe-2S)-binding protein [Desulfobacteraceae bacterium 4572_87]|nr:MAG: (2Fe-2S)-binding protein [Desulfobacteraceae bacterium 4572_87]